MIELSPGIITVIMLGGILVGVLFGYPLGIILGAIALAVGVMLFGPQITSEIMYMRIFSSLNNPILLAVPLFIFMGVTLEHSGIAQRSYHALHIWLSGFRGGLAIATVLLGTLLAACVGVISASVTMLSLIALPSMINRGYSKSLSAGSVCAGGTLGILIPPSIMLVVYGPMAGISVGRLFFGAILPGLLLTGLYSVYITFWCLLKPKAGPSDALEENRGISFTKKTTMLLVAIVPVGALICAVLGTIFLGIASPSEAAGVGAFVAILLSIIYRRFNLGMLKEALLNTLKTVGMVFLICSMAFAFVGVFMRAHCGEVVQSFILSVPGEKWGAFTLMMIVCFILGMFIDWLGIVLIMVPIMTPISAALGFDPVWFAIMVCVNLQMSFLTPPFALAIFLVRGSASPELGLTTTHIIRGVIPFVGLIVVALLLLIAFPEIILWLPDKML